MVFTRVEKKRIKMLILSYLHRHIDFLFFRLSEEDECLATCQDGQELFRWTGTRQERPNQIYQTEGIF